MNDSIPPLLSKKNRYKGDKLVIEDAIKNGDKLTLKEMLDSNTKDFPDLIKIIEDTLKEMK